MPSFLWPLFLGLPAHWQIVQVRGMQGRSTRIYHASDSRSVSAVAVWVLGTARKMVWRTKRAVSLSPMKRIIDKHAHKAHSECAQTEKGLHHWEHPQSLFHDERGCMIMRFVVRLCGFVIAFPIY